MHMAKSDSHIIEEPPFYVTWFAYLGLLVLFIVGKVDDFFGKIFYPDEYVHIRVQDGYAPLMEEFGDFFRRRVLVRIYDCFHRPVTGVPGRFVTLLDREFVTPIKWRLLGGQKTCINLGSYNYLGFSQSEGSCVDADESAIREYGVSFSSVAEGFQAALHSEAEELVADYVGKPAAMIYSQGFCTNAATIPALVDERSVVVSDELNHASIRMGCQLSGAKLKTFNHNDMKHLEKVLRQAVVTRPNKILVVVEGLYSMEGTTCDLPSIIALKRRYKFFLYVDEAHSVGALGSRGRGICDYFGIDPARVDILMGTFSKSFGAVGGYIAGSPEVISKLRHSDPARLAEMPSPVVLTQIMSSLGLMAAPGDGQTRIRQLAFNSQYLRAGLKRLGFIVYGQEDTPIIPLLLYSIGKMPAFSRRMLDKGIAVVVVGYPATSLTTARVRFCVSAAHTKEDLDKVLEACDQLGDELLLKFKKTVPESTARHHVSALDAVKPGIAEVADAFRSSNPNKHLLARIAEIHPLDNSMPKTILNGSAL